MRLTPSDPDIQTLVNRIRSCEIDLQPDFQRGEVWSTAKKQRLVDSILRDWHIPPLHVIVDSDSGQQLVLDGQQRLAAIRDFVDGVFSVDGRIEPASGDLQEQHGKRYSSLRPDLKRRFDQFTIRVFRVTDYSPEEPGELFYRLNQPTALTAAEQRNAFFGETRRQIKELVGALECAKLGEGFLGFSNARMAYDDMLSRVALFLEHNSLKKRVTAGTLADRFRSGQAFDHEAIESLFDVIQLCGKAKESIREAPQFNKATAQSWLVFLTAAKKYLKTDFTPDLVGDFISEFEIKRFEYQIGVAGETSVEERLRALLMRTYEDRSTARVADALSVQARDFVIWSCFLLDRPSVSAIALQHSDSLRELEQQLREPTLENWQSVEKIVTSLNWGDPLWR